MTGLAQLEEQLNNINALNKTSSKALDTFADTSNSISTRARQITRDVRPWEVAQENIALTIEEMSKAARCYHPPPCLAAVLSKKDVSPEAIARCVDYLVYTDDYLASHPPNVYGDEIQSKTSVYIQKIVDISEEIVRTAFIKAFQKPKVPVPDRVLIKNPAALDNVALVVQRLGENFNRLDVLRVDVFSMLEDKITSFIEANFDATYLEEEAGKSSLSSHASMAPVLRHYQKGEHRLLGISASARSCVEEFAACVKDNILVPLDDDYAVAEMPSELAIAAFSIILARAEKLIKFDLSSFNDPSMMFVLSRGQGVGLCPGVRYFRDIIFVGLDMLEELWNWKTLSTKLPGENDNCISYIDSEVEQFMYHVRDLLDGYLNCKGGLKREALLEHTRTLRKVEWIPAPDCTVHESTTNLLYFHKILLANYFGSMKLILYGNTIDATGDLEATKEVEDYLVRCVLGNLQDLLCIGEATIELQDEAEESRKHHIRRSSLMEHAFGADGGKSKISIEVFLINNILFLMENYRREPCFTQRVIPQAPPPPGSRKTDKKAKKSEPPTPIIQYVLTLLTDEKERYVDEYAASWEHCFPSIYDDPTLSHLSRNADTPLRKSERAAAKSYFKVVGERLQLKINGCRTQAVMDSTVRSRLIEVSVAAVREQFKMIDDVLLGRAWSDRPLKYMLFDEEGWTSQIRGAF